MTSVLSDIHKDSTRLISTILDISVLSSYSHRKTLVESQNKFYISETFYELIEKKNKREEILEIMQYFSHRSLKHYSLDKENLIPILEPYRFKEKYITDIVPYLSKSSLPETVKKIILDQYSFLKQNSNILMRTKRFANHLHRMGIVIFNAINKHYDTKSKFFRESRGLRWLFGFIISAMGMSQLSENPILGQILDVSGIIFVIVDP